MFTVVPAAPTTFKGSGIQFDYPADWQTQKSSTSVLSLLAPVKAAAPGDPPTMCLDVPKLPWHLPGMITVDRVASGYVDDLRKSLMQDAVLKDQSKITIGSETAKKLTCTGHVNGKLITDISIIIVHADQVYIFSADSCEQGCDLTRKTMNSVVSSIKWIK